MMNIGPAKRQRPNKSCTLCREKKTKCDRAKPVCGSCEKRKHPEQCKYEGPEWSVRIGEDSYITTARPTKQTKVTSEQILPPMSNKIEITRESPSNFSKSPVPMLNHASPQIRSSSEASDTNPPTVMPPRAHQQQLPPIIPPAHQPSPQSNLFHPFLPTPNPQPPQFTPFDKLSVSNLVSPETGGSPNTPLPNDADDQVIDFYRNNYGEPTILGQGIFTWVTFLKKDAYARAVVMSSKKDKVVFTNMKNAKKDAFTDKFYVELDMDENEGGANVMSNVKSKNKDICHAIKSVISDRKLVWFLVNKFFESELICVFPLLDKEDFTQEVTSIIGSNESSKQFKFTKRIQFATIGTLLLVMRLASLTPYNAGRKSTRILSDADVYIRDHPLTKEIVAVAKLCHGEVQRFKDAHLITFQFNLLMVHYNFYGPEDCDCIASTATGNIGPLLHSAIALGLNRDPKISHPNYKNPELLKRLWHLVVYLDYYQTMLVGYPPMINKSFYDVELPRLVHNDSAMTYVIHESFHERKKIADLCEPLLMRIMSVNNKPKIREVITLLKPVENYFETFLKLEDILKIPSDTVMHRVTKLRVHNGATDLFALVFMMYYHLFLHYSENDNSERSLYYCLQLLKLCNYILPALYNFQKAGSASTNEHFDLNSEFGVTILVMPKVELCLHKISEFMLSLLARVKTFKIIADDNTDPEILKLADDIGDSLFKIIFFLLESFANISDTYYHSWCITKIQSFILEKILRNTRGPVARSDLESLEKDYIDKIEPLIEEDKGMFLYSKQELQQIYNEIEIMDLASLGQTPSPERLLFDLNSYKIKNDQLWLDQLFEGNFNPDHMQPLHNHGHGHGHTHSSSGSDRMDLNDNGYNTMDNNNGSGGNGNGYGNPTSSSVSFDRGFFDLEQMLYQTAKDF